jgi:hypothetical protein
LAPLQIPLTQVSVCVQALPSLQPVPSLAGGFVHLPVVASHAPAW